MRRLVVICEGPTEQEFCNDLLRGYFRQKDVWLDAPPSNIPMAELWLGTH